MLFLPKILHMRAIELIGAMNFDSALQGKAHTAIRDLKKDIDNAIGYLTLVR